MCRKENSKQKSLTQEHTPTPSFIYLFPVSNFIQAFKVLKRALTLQFSNPQPATPQSAQTFVYYVSPALDCLPMRYAAICKS